MRQITRLIKKCASHVQGSKSSVYIPLNRTIIDNYKQNIRYFKKIGNVVLIFLEIFWDFGDFKHRNRRKKRFIEAVFKRKSSELKIR